MRRYLISLSFICMLAVYCNPMTVPDVIELPVPGMPVEQVNIKDTDDPLAADSLEEVINDQLKTLVGYMIARTQTADDKRSFIHYYADIPTLNSHLFGKLYPESYLDPFDKSDPVTNLKFSSWDDITYYYTQEPSNRQLIYLGSAQDLMPPKPTPWVAPEIPEKYAKRMAMQKWFRALYGKSEDDQVELGIIRIQAPKKVAPPSDLIPQLEKMFTAYKKQPTESNYREFKKFWVAHSAQFTDKAAVLMNTFVDAIAEHIRSKATPAQVQGEVLERSKNAETWRGSFKKSLFADQAANLLPKIETALGDVQYVSIEERNKLFGDYIDLIRSYLLENKITKATEMANKAIEKYETWSLYPSLNLNLINEFQRLLQQADPRYAQIMREKLQKEQKEQRQREEEFMRRRQQEEAREKEALAALAEQRRLATMSPQAQRLDAALRQLAQALNELYRKIYPAWVHD